MRTMKETDTKRTEVFFSTLKASVFRLPPVMFQFQKVLCFFRMS
jgi:hypothetical protein